MQKSSLHFTVKEPVTGYLKYVTAQENTVTAENVH
jgi:hypothetical protein